MTDCRFLKRYLLPRRKTMTATENNVILLLKDSSKIKNKIRMPLSPLPFNILLEFPARYFDQKRKIKEFQ